MRFIFFSIVFILLFASCNNENDAVTLTDIYQVSYSTPERLQPSMMSFVADNNDYLVAATISDDSANPGVFIYNMNVKGDISWSNRIEANDEAHLSVFRILRISGEKNLLLAHGQHQLLFIQIDNAGSILSSKKIGIGASINLHDCFVNNAGNVIGVGSISDSKTIVFEFNPKTNVMLWSRQILQQASGSFSVASGKYTFITIVEPGGSLLLLKLDDNGKILFTKKLYTNSSYFSKSGRSVVIGDNLYLISSFLHGNMIGLLRLDLNGNIKTAMRIDNAEFSDVKVYEKNLLFGISLASTPSLIRIDTDFKIVNHKTIAEASGPGEHVHGVLGFNDHYISYASKSDSGDQGINVVKLDRRNWETSCEWPLIALDENFISAITIYDDTATSDSEELTLSVGDYGVKTESITLAKSNLCLKEN